MSDHHEEVCETIFDLPTAFTVSSAPRVNRAIGVTLRLGFSQKAKMKRLQQFIDQFSEGKDDDQDGTLCQPPVT